MTKYPILQKILKMCKDALLWIIVIVSGMTTVFEWFNLTPADFQNFIEGILNIKLKEIELSEGSIFNYAGLVFLLSVTFLFFQWFGFSGLSKILRKNIGKEAGEIASKALFNIVLPVSWQSAIMRIHHFEHQMHKYKRIFRSALLDSNEYKNSIIDCLRELQHGFSDLTGLHYSINIKIFEKENNSSNDVLYDDIYMYTYVRISSPMEDNLIDTGLLERPRRNNEKFQIIPGQKGAPDKLKAMAHLKKSDRERRMNSAYNMVLGEGSHYWICNDLESAVRDGKYYSSSENFIDYYKSIAIFSLSPPIDTSDTAVDVGAIGLLIIDSPVKGAFPYSLTKYMAGWYAHRFFDIFTMLNGDD